MSYTALYRKFRPSEFADVKGQDHIITTLQNQIKANRIGHAYLFCGTRGTGKTTVAKIFAKAVNCEHPSDGSPCGECKMCRSISAGTSMNVIEIDAASNNGVNEMRDLREKVQYPPVSGKYKVYIVDEVHMLTDSAFNALLKTLEEPPAHAIFVLATTEVHQIPATVLSRCLRFDFHLLPLSLIEKRLKFIFDDIKVKCDADAVRLIASAGRGSMRDALSIADMCVSYCAGNITYDGVLEVLGTADPFKVLDLAEAVLSGDADAALVRLAALCDLGKSVPVLASDLGAMFRNMMYAATCKNAREILALPADLFGAIDACAARYPVKKIFSSMKAMTSLEGQFRYGTQHRTLLEAAVLEAATNEPSAESFRELAEKVDKLERQIKALTKSGFNPAPVKADARQVWGRVVSALNAKGFRHAAMAATDAAVEETEDVFRVRIASAASMSLLDDDGVRALIDRTFASLSKKSLVIEQGGALVRDREVPYLTEMFGARLEVK